MIKVGLTGGIGSGKSLVARILHAFGVPVYDSDSATKQLYITNPALKSKLIQSFGEQAYYEDGQLNRRFLGNLVFNDKSKLKLINEIVHPFVKLDFEEWLKTKKHKEYVVKEAAVLIESGAYRQVDKIVVVTAPREIRIDRVMKRDKTSKEEVIKRIDNQLSDEKMLSFANYVVVNDGDKALLPQIIRFHNQLQK